MVMAGDAVGGETDPAPGVPWPELPRGGDADALDNEGAAMPTMGLFRGRAPAEPMKAASP